MVYKHVMLSMVKMLLKGEVGGRALNSHGNYIVDHGKSWKNHGIVILNFCGNPDFIDSIRLDLLTVIVMLRRIYELFMSTCLCKILK